MQVPEITVAELKQELGQADVQVVDVRTDAEWLQAHLQGSNIQHIDMQQITAAVGNLNPAQRTLVLCRSGGRSALVVEWLQQQGFKDVANVQGGLLAWREQIDPTLAIT